MSNKTIIYVGKDRSFWKKISSDLTQILLAAKVPVKTKVLFDEKEIQSLYPKIAALNPTLIFVDYSAKASDFMHLSRLIRRVNATRFAHIIGLFDTTDNQHVIQESIIAGSSINHLKDGEMHNIIYDALAIAFPEQLKAHGFFSAELEDVIEAKFFAKVGKVCSEHIQIEFDGILPEKRIFQLNHYWQELGIIPSSEFTNTKKQIGGAYYDFKYTYTFNFNYIDELLEDEYEDENELVERQNIREQDIEQSKLSFEKWIAGNDNKSSPKFIKALVIEYDLSIYREQRRTDRYPFLLRAQPFFFNIHTETVVNQPHIIIVNLDQEAEEVNEKESQEEYYQWPNSFEMLKSLIKKINAFEDYDPYIFVFNTMTLTEEEKIESLGYERILQNTSPFKPALLEKLVEIFKSKNPDLLEEDHNCLYPKKSELFSTVEYVNQITMRKLSETDCIFDSKDPITMGATFRVDHPINMLLTVTPKKGFEGNTGTYYALVNGVGEQQLKELRRFLNEIQFKDKTEQRKQELEDFKNLNKKVQIERMEAEQKEEEEKKKFEEEDAPKEKDDQEGDDDS